MRLSHILRMLIVAAVLIAGPSGAYAQVAQNEAAAEAALKNCELEKSLRLWRAVLTEDPNHRRARFVVARLTARALDLDSQLDVIDTLIEKGAVAGVEKLLDAAADRAATDFQKARILYLRGKHAMVAATPTGARAAFESAATLYADTEWGARAAMALAEGDWPKPAPGRPQRLLQAVVDNAKLPKSVREEAALKQLVMESGAWTPQRRLDALRKRLAATSDTGVKRMALLEIVTRIVETQGRWTAEAVESAVEILRADPSGDESARIVAKLQAVAAESQDAAALDALVEALAGLKPADKPLARAAARCRAEALVSPAVVAEDLPALKRFIAEADRVAAALTGDSPTAVETARLHELRGRRLLVEAQKLLAMAGPTQALPAVMKAKDHFLADLPADPSGSLTRLERIGKLLTHAREWETAAALCREIADAYPHTPQARDALLTVATLQETKLNDPVTALETCAEYAARYPAEVPYRQLKIGERLARLGYANLLDFQKRNGLKPDGLYGPTTRSKLKEIESGFDAIRVVTPAPVAGKTKAGLWNERFASERASTVLRGTYVHPRIFRIARRLERQGRSDEAVRAYRLFLNLLPT